jgi:histone RNA hairpin-binding protein
LSEKNAHFLKNLKAPTAVTLPIAMNQSPPKYVPPHKKTPEKTTPVEPLVEQVRAEEVKVVEKPVEVKVAEPAKETAVAPVKPDLAAVPKVITLEWKPKKVKKLKPRETDPKRLASRQKQIDIGKNTIGYKEYIAKVPK